MILRPLILLAAICALAPPAAAQVACRTTTLGTTACSGPAPARDTDRQIFTDGLRGLAAVQPRPERRDPPPERIPAFREDAFGNTLLAPGTARPLPDNCRRSPLGHLLCR